MDKQGTLIENVAIQQLAARRDRLVAQQTQARFGVADSYDRAARAQPGAGDADAAPRHPDAARAGSRRRLRHAAPGAGTLADLRKVSRTFRI